MHNLYVKALLTVTSEIYMLCNCTKYLTLIL